MIVKTLIIALAAGIVIGVPPLFSSKARNREFMGGLVLVVGVITLPLYLLTLAVHFDGAGGSQTKTVTTYSVDLGPDGTSYPKLTPQTRQTFRGEAAISESETYSIDQPEIVKPVEQKPVTPPKTEEEKAIEKEESQQRLNNALIFLGVIAAIIVLGLWWVKGRDERQAKREERLALRENNKRLAEEKVRQWQEVRETYQQTMRNIISYETDVNLAIRYPAMNDVSEQATSIMLTELNTTKALASSVNMKDELGGSNELLEKFSRSVYELKTKFRVAEDNAKRVALSHLSKTDQRDLEQAKQLLDHASDRATPPKLRETYLQRLDKLIKRINTRARREIIPQSAVQAIEEQTRLAIDEARAS